eukprot:gene20367-23134_t
MTSYGKTENSFLKVKSILGLVEKSHLQVYVNNIPIENMQLLHQNHFAVGVSDLHLLHELLRVPANLDIIERDHSLMTNLSMSNQEHVAQIAIAPVAAALGTKDTSASSPGVFHHALSMRDGDGRECTAVYPLSAKPDLLKSVGHVLVELKCTPGAGTYEGTLVKNDFEVLYQSIDRIYTIRNTTAYARLAVCFAATGRAAWAVIYTQAIDSTQAECIHIIRIKHSDIFTMLHALHHLPWSHYWHSDSNIVRATINSLGYSADKCCVRIIGQSMCKVYAISFPKKRYHMGSNSTDIGECASEPDCCIKVCADIGSFNREVEALSATAVAYAQHDDGKFFALGAMTVAPNSFVYEVCEDVHDDYDEQMRRFIKSNPDRLFLRWSTDSLALPSSVTLRPTENPIGDYCGCILMKVGERVNKNNTSISACISGMLYSLERLHEAGYLHTDIRHGNYLRFGANDVQVIDFDHTVPMSANITGRALVRILRGSTQHQYVGERIRSVFEKQAEHMEITVYWGTADDIEMSLVALLSEE